jgi:hypothetical protein
VKSAFHQELQGEIGSASLIRHWQEDASIGLPSQDPRPDACRWLLEVLGAAIVDSLARFPAGT